MTTKEAAVIEQPRIKRFYLYVMSPIDWGWKLLLSVEEYKHRADEGQEDQSGVDRTLAELDLVRECARNAGWWEGDGMAPRIFPVPCDSHDFEIGFAWKQPNNGTTFIASPVELRHLSYGPRGEATDVICTDGHRVWVDGR
jgi:hypothetical protein